MEEQMRSEILKTIPYGFYITGVVGSDGDGEAVLLRAGEVVMGAELARSRRP